MLKTIINFFTVKVIQGFLVPYLVFSKGGVPALVQGTSGIRGITSGISAEFPTK